MKLNVEFRGCSAAGTECRGRQDWTMAILGLTILAEDFLVFLYLQVNYCPGVFK